MDAIPRIGKGGRLAMPETDQVICEACEGTGKNFFSCCGDDMRGRDFDNCPTCHEHTGWDGESDGECIECGGSGKA